MLVWVPFVEWVDARDATILISLSSLIISVLAFVVMFVKYRSDMKRAIDADKMDLINSLIHAQSLATSAIVKLDLMSTGAAPDVADQIQKVRGNFLVLLQDQLVTLNEELLKPGAKIDNLVEYKDKVTKAHVMIESMHDQIDVLYSSSK